MTRLLFGLGALLITHSAHAQFRGLTRSQPLMRQIYTFNTSSGTLQNAIAPRGARQVVIHAWGGAGGAGAGGSNSKGGAGGAGGFVATRLNQLNLSSLNLKIYVGQGGGGGGRSSGAPAGKGGGGGTGTTVTAFNNTTLVYAAGGGAGGGGTVNSEGGAGGAAGSNGVDGTPVCTTNACAGAGLGGVSSSGANTAGASHGSCFDVLNTYTAIANTPGGNGVGGNGGSCQNGGVQAETAGNGVSKFDVTVNKVCSSGAGGAGYPGGGGAGVEASATLGCAGGGGGANQINTSFAGLSVITNQTGDGRAPPRTNDPDWIRNGSFNAQGGLPSFAADGAAGQPGFVVVYWY